MNVDVELWIRRATFEMSTTAGVKDKKKSNLLYITYVHFLTNPEKICTTFDLKS